eukprot:TRINITY_DN7587_c0_g1_i1.p1 TRINITY_DN7587_c0_g1~~TRINITY_DN7587_c0_g1_i1.p1  ORF type:complete len:689 (+),score=115.53 TRINITY_DN7587_c0_g1_i1:60-2126(+)
MPMCDCHGTAGFLNAYSKCKFRINSNLKDLPCCDEILSVVEHLKADTIILAKRIYTMDTSKPHAEGLAVWKGRLLAVGTCDEVMAKKGPETKVQDYRSKGWIVFPGFVDAHMHASFATLRPWLDLGPVTGRCDTTLQAKAKLIEAVKKAASSKTWIQARMVDPSLQTGPPFSFDMFDEIKQLTGYDNPIFILESNGHVAYANRKAFELAGVTEASAPLCPQPGRFIMKNGSLTGRMEEQPAFFPFIGTMQQMGASPTPEQQSQYILEDFNDASSCGCTTLTDMGLGNVAGVDDVKMMEHVMKQDPPVRYAAALVCNPQRPPETAASTTRGGGAFSMDVWRDMGLKPGMHQKLFHLIAIKAWADGSNQGKTGYQTEPYLALPTAAGRERPDFCESGSKEVCGRKVDVCNPRSPAVEALGRFWRGVGEKLGVCCSKADFIGSRRAVSSDNLPDHGALNYNQEQLEYVIRESVKDGWQVCIHANGDGAIDVTLNAYEKALADPSLPPPRGDPRHRIEHCSLLRSDQIARMNKLSISPSFLIGHVHYWGNAFQKNILGVKRANLLCPAKSALRGGLRISLHSDYNVTPMKPLEFVRTAVVRDMKYGAGRILNAAERISVEEAFRAITIDAAWQCRLDHLCGSLVPGKCCDLAIVAQDPFEVDPTRIADVAVVETWLVGARKYENKGKVEIIT